MTVLRNRSNQLAGLALVAMSIALFVGADPWMLWQYEGLPPSDRMTSEQSALATASLCLVASVGVTFARLRVIVGVDDRIVVVNPLHTWRFDRSQVASVERGALPRARLKTGETIWLFALENAPADRLRGTDRSAPLRDPDRRTGHPGARPEPRATRRTASGVVPLVSPWVLGAAASVLGLLVSASR
ncbi:hypothetical protein ACFCZ3_06455 [Cellulosimicrobium cellulans]|uniref:hypothetical protein n=1 Tax=Cellulosimicrobium cellulans TaxID=1710 RepID=UPI0035DF7A91